MLFKGIVIVFSLAVPVYRGKMAAALNMTKKDMKDLPDALTLDAYESMPVDSFGESILRNLGWAPGQPIGASSKA